MAAAAAIFLSGCQLRDSGPNLVNGKTLFTQECARCHTLARANATGVVGPNLDVAFAQSRKDGLGESTFEGIVRQWILHPNINPQVDPKTGKRTALMPAKIFEGKDASDVAAYVASAAAAGQGQGPPRRRRRPEGQRHRRGEERHAGHPGRPARPRLQVRRRRRPPPATSRSPPRTPRPTTTTSRSRATASTRRARSSRAEPPPRSPSTSSPASTRSSAPSPATARAAWWASSPSSSLARSTSALEDQRDDHRDHEHGDDVEQDAERVPLVAQRVEARRHRPQMM